MLSQFCWPLLFVALVPQVHFTYLFLRSSKRETEVEAVRLDHMKYNAPQQLCRAKKLCIGKRFSMRAQPWCTDDAYCREKSLALL